MKSIFWRGPKERNCVSIAFHLRIESYTKDMHPANVDRAIEKAFNLWSQVTPLTFTKIFEGEADIMISFVYGGEPLLCGGAFSFFLF